MKQKHIKGMRTQVAPVGVANIVDQVV